MIWRKRNKEQERFYLLPGMGGRASRRKHKVFLVWSIVAGLTVSILFAVALFFLNRR
ncbi:MAG TPA: hypothetical protein VG754_05350 [Verrucomicrobiae bacterium]|jgi:hypothetical protein|nr:hypothetical protein [Verrucomicrobiae bacterium]